MQRTTSYHKERQEPARVGAAIALSKANASMGDSVIVSGQATGVVGPFTYYFERLSGSTIIPITDVGMVFVDQPPASGTYTYRLTITTRSGQSVTAESNPVVVS